MAFTDVYDIIRIAKSDKLSVKFSDETIHTSHNTVSQAIQLISAHCAKTPNFAITIQKNIPIGAGLGGGSADAAAILKFLCKKWNIKMSSEVYDLALQVGADVPVCLQNKACIIDGIGEKIHNIQSLPSFPTVLVNPGISVSTKEIFQKVTKYNTADLHNKQDNILDRIISSQNDLQEVTISLHPQIANVIKAISQQSGCLVARMSGSGSTCFGLFTDTKSAQKACSTLYQDFPWVKFTYLR